MKPYRVLVTGSRDWTDAALIDKALQAECLVAVGERRPLVVVHGGAPRAQPWRATHCARLAEEAGIPVKRYTAD